MRAGEKGKNAMSGCRLEPRHRLITPTTFHHRSAGSLSLAGLTRCHELEEVVVLQYPRPLRQQRVCHLLFPIAPMPQHESVPTVPYTSLPASADSIAVDSVAPNSQRDYSTFSATAANGKPTSLPTHDDEHAARSNSADAGADPLSRSVSISSVSSDKELPVGDKFTSAKAAAYYAYSTGRDPHVYEPVLSLTSLCLFVTATGFSVGWTAIVFGSVVYYQNLYGKDCLLFLNTCVYLPGVIVAVLQAKYDARIYAHFGANFTVSGRMILCYTLLLALLIVLPYLPENFDPDKMGVPGAGNDTTKLAFLLAVVAGIGSLSSTLYSCAVDMAGHMPRQFIASVVAGMQLSGIICLMLTFATGFGKSATRELHQRFMLCATGVTAFGFVMYLLLHWRSLVWQEVLLRRDLYNGRGAEEYSHSHHSSHGDGDGSHSSAIGGGSALLHSHAADSAAELESADDPSISVVPSLRTSLAERHNTAASPPLNSNPAAGVVSGVAADPRMSPLASGLPKAAYALAKRLQAEQQVRQSAEQQSPVYSDRHVHSMPAHSRQPIASMSPDFSKYASPSANPFVLADGSIDPLLLNSEPGYRRPAAPAAADQQRRGTLGAPPRRKSAPQAVPRSSARPTAQQLEQRRIAASQRSDAVRRRAAALYNSSFAGLISSETFGLPHSVEQRHASLLLGSSAGAAARANVGRAKLSARAGRITLADEEKGQAQQQLRQQLLLQQASDASDENDHSAAALDASDSSEKSDALTAPSVAAYIAILRRIYAPLFALYFTAGCSVLLAGLYPFVPVEGGGNNSSVVLTLVYLRLGCDMFGRMLHMFPAMSKLIESPRTLLFIACARNVLCVPAFFLYLLGVIPPCDIAILCSIAAYAALSGYLNTSAFALAPQGIEQEKKSLVANCMNIAFQTCLITGLLGGFVLRFTLLRNQ